MEKAPRHHEKQLDLLGARSPGKPADYKPFVPGPNPELPDFIRKHSTPYDPATDTYDVKAFDRDLVVDKAAPPKAIYDMHTYWSKKHWAAIREYIRHYLPEKHYPKGTGLVLDCFSGSGMTGVAAMMEGRPCVLIDASPAAAFISHCYTHPVDPDELQAAYNRMMTEEYPEDLKAKLRKVAGRPLANLQEELDWLYETKCDRCGGPATTEYVVYSERFQCPNCAEVVALFDCPEARVPYQVGSARKQKTELKKRRVCPHCMRKHGEPNKGFVISTRTKRFGSVPVLVSYECQSGCKPKRGQRRHDDPRNTRKGRFFDECDLAKLDSLEKAEIPHWVPDRKMMDVQDDSKPWGVKWRAGTSNFRTVAELYTKRNLWALGAINGSISRACPEGVREEASLALSAGLYGVSKMVRESNTATVAGTYYLPQISKEVLVCGTFASKMAMIQRGCDALYRNRSSPPVVSHQGVCDLDPNAAIMDYLFTDPPYVGKIQYGELNFVWESWLGFEGDWFKDEIIVNPYRGKSLDDWDSGMRIALRNCFRVLKPGRWLSLCYHDTEPDTWARIQNILLDTGFEIHTVTVLDPKQKSLNQLSAEKVVKSDLVLNCRKPRPGEDREGRGEEGLISQRVRDILVETLSTHGGQARDRLWDIVLQRLLTRGQMAEHRFDDILAEVATRSESARWFLKEEFEALSQSDIRNEEDAGSALTRFARLRCAGVPVEFATRIALETPHLVSADLDEKEVAEYIRDRFLKDPAARRDFKLGGRMKGTEFYDCLFFYLTRFLKGRPTGKTPRRNLADFLEEYLVRFRDGDKWFYRPPDAREAEELRKSRQSGLGRRIRQFTAYLKGEGAYPEEKMPDPKTLVAWLRHCASFSLAEEGVLLYEKGGLMGRLQQLSEDERYDAEDYYAQCRRGLGRRHEADDEIGDEEGGEETEDE